MGELATTHPTGRSYRGLISLTLILLFGAVVQAQTSGTATDGTTLPGIAAGAPAGSYALSGFDIVNLYNGNLNFALPLVRVGGRGEAQYAMTVRIEQRWRMHKSIICSSPGCSVLYVAEPNWWTGIEPGYGPGVLLGRAVDYMPDGCQNQGFDNAVSLTRLTFTGPDGTEYELRDQLNQGSPISRASCTNPMPSRGTVFTSADGSAATFVSDQAISDTVFGGVIYPSGNLLFRDGTRYRIDQGLVTSIRDRNGNLLSFVYDQNSRVIKVTDSINRQVTITYHTGSIQFDEITYSGFGGAERTIRVWFSSLGDVLRDGFSLGTFDQLFPPPPDATPIPSSTLYNPSVISAVELPDGRRYEFSYNSHSELARVVLPTGGAFEYDWAPGAGTLAGGIVNGGSDFDEGQKVIAIYRRVIERRVYVDGTTLEGSTTFTSTETNNTVVRVDHSASGQLLASERHYFFGAPSVSLVVGPPSKPDLAPTDYPTWREGREFRTESYQTDGVTLLRRTDQEWRQRAPISWWNQTLAEAEPANDPRIIEAVATLSDTNQVTKRRFAYDLYNNTTDIWEHDYGPGAPGPLVRHIHTDFLTTNAGTNYATNTSVHIRSLPLVESVRDDGEVERARTTYEYDNYTPDPNHAPLLDRAAIPGHDPSFTTSKLARGNVTKVSRFLNTGGSINSYAQYDIAGNIVKSIDPRGNATSVGYSSTFGFTYPTELTRPIPDPTGLNGSSVAFTSFASYDLSTGLVTSLTDENGQITIAQYNDSLDRLTRIIRPSGGGSTTYVYSDTPGNPFIQTQATQSSTQTVTADQVFDGLGRPTISRLYAPEGAIITTQNYDGMGRVKRITNPYRSTTDPTYGSTETTYDGLSRAISVQTFDGVGASTGVIRTDYSGNLILVTDQAGKQRLSQTNGIGQMIDVWEICPADTATVPVSFPNHPEVTAGYRTSYGYDGLDDLTSVIQRVGTGGTLQTRTFIYDSLQRLKQAINPESGAMTYEYDNNGNLKQRTDARGIRVDYFYDGLDRPTSRSYTDGTPAVTYKYDGAGTSGVLNSKGRLTLVTSSVSSYSYDEYDSLGRVLKCAQQTAGQSYLMSYEYDRAGNLISQTYPGQTYTSGRKVRNAYDTAGRIAGITGQKTSEPEKSYSSSYGYAPHGAVSAMTFGNNLIEHTSFNSRLQPLLIGLGSSMLDSGKLKLEYTYGTANNNGNVLSQKITVPGLSQSLHQSYGYDSLNRLLDARENQGTNAGLQTWRQRFIYDRFGNRNLDTAQSTVIGQNPTISQANNRIDVNANPAYGYDPAGNLTKQPGGSTPDTMAYDAENRQIRFTAGQTGAITTYDYDGDGRRVKKVSVP